MCLATITKKLKPTKKVGYGYKWFSSRLDGNITFPFFTCTELVRGKWLQADTVSVMCMDGSYYTSGFHVFKVRKAAEDCTYEPATFRLLPLSRCRNSITVQIGIKKE